MIVFLNRSYSALNFCSSFHSLYEASLVVSSSLFCNSVTCSNSSAFWLLSSLALSFNFSYLYILDLYASTLFESLPTVFCKSSTCFSSDFSFSFLNASLTVMLESFSPFREETTSDEFKLSSIASLSL